MALIAQYLFNDNCNSETGSYNGSGSRMQYQTLPSGYHFGGKAAVFDGWSNSTRTSISFSNYNWQSTWTVETWYRRAHAGNNDLFMHIGTNWTTNQLIHLGVNSSNKLRFAFYANDLDAPGTYTDANWHHLVFTYNNSTKERQIFCDGVRVANDIASATFSGTSTWYVGWYNTDNNFCGWLSNLRIWNEVLSDVTIQSHYNQEKADKTIYSYNYNGGIQTFTTPVNGYYKLETWGAGGGGNPSYMGGCGGYSVGVVELQKDQILYVAAGQLGNTTTSSGSTAPASFNGGGSSKTSSYSGVVGGGGGGATHIATVSGELKDLANNQSNILIVSGGGGGGFFTNTYNRGQGGQGGGFNGMGGSGYGADNNANANRRSGGGTQTTGGVTPAGGYAGGFGYGANSTSTQNGEGGGGGSGWYGGSSALIGPGGGGSGYIGSNDLISYGGVTKHMTGYSVTTSSNPDTLTYSNSNAHYVPLADNEMRAGGFVQITLIEEIVPPSTDFNTAASLLMLV